MKYIPYICFAVLLLTVSPVNWAAETGWCATRNSVSESASYLCKYMGGKFFTSQNHDFDSQNSNKNSWPSLSRGILGCPKIEKRKVI